MNLSTAGRNFESPRRLKRKPFPVGGAAGKMLPVHWNLCRKTPSTRWLVKQKNTLVTLKKCAKKKTIILTLYVSLTWAWLDGWHTPGPWRAAARSARCPPPSGSRWAAWRGSTCATRQCTPPERVHGGWGRGNSSKKFILACSALDLKINDDRPCFWRWLRTDPDSATLPIQMILYLSGFRHTAYSNDTDPDSTTLPFQMIPVPDPDSATLPIQNSNDTNPDSTTLPFQMILIRILPPCLFKWY